MGFDRLIRLFNAYPPFVAYRDSLKEPVPDELNNKELRARALELAQTVDHHPDRSELEAALDRYRVIFDETPHRQVSAMVHFMADLLFRDLSVEFPPDLGEQIRTYDGPAFFFVVHSSYYDYMLAARLSRELGLAPPVMHVSGTVTRGWLSNWLTGLRHMKTSKIFSHVEHRAYTWFSAAVAEQHQNQVLFARTSRYTVRAREGILREPYVPHGLVAAVKTTGKALVIPVAVSYSVIPEDRYLTASTLLSVWSMLPRHPVAFLPYLYGVKKPSKLFRSLRGAFGDAAISVGRPFELNDDESLTSQRISHRAIVEVARNKVIQPTHVVAKALQKLEMPDSRDIRQQVEREVESTSSFFRTRYRAEAPFHHLIADDLPTAIREGLHQLQDRGAVVKTAFRRRYKPRDWSLLQFYGYHGDRRVYPLSGRNTLTVVNAGAWGYTLALHIGSNLLQKEELAEHALVLYDSREDLIEKLTVEGKHPWHFKDILVPRTVRPEADLVAAVRDTSLILVVTPSKYFYQQIRRVLEHAPEGSDLVLATKGFIPETGLLPCQTTHMEMERLGKRMRLAVLSGANLAHEIVQGGAGVTQIACEEWETFERLRSLIETDVFRVVYSADVIGATISAALKNVYAIGFGILEGSKLAPENFLATYATLATAEIRKFGMLLGASPQTFDAESQAWTADLLATCRGGRSARFGQDLAAIDEKHGKHMPARALLEQYRKKKMAIEGFEAARYAQRMASQRGFHPPILGEIYSILHGGKRVDVNGLVQKCLDALPKHADRPIPSTVKLRYQRY